MEQVVLYVNVVANIVMLELTYIYDIIFVTYILNSSINYM
jgi:hypothetical protein